MAEKRSVYSTTMHFGGMFRCCANLCLPNYINENQDETAVVGTTLTCPHCGSQLRLDEEYVWRAIVIGISGKPSLM